MTARARHVLLILGHPDAHGGHLCHALADAYAEGALQAGHEIRRIDVARLDFPLLRSKQQWEEGAVPPALHPAQMDIGWSEHVVLFFPLWLGDIPALLKAFLEQVARPGFAVGKSGQESLGTKLLKGRSARVVVTMGMPALVYRWYFRAHGVKSLARNILGFVGFAPVSKTLIGGVEGLKDDGVARWLARMRKAGARGD